MARTFQDPSTGDIYDIPDEQAEQAMADGLKPTGTIVFHDREGAVYDIPEAHADEARADGLRRGLAPKREEPGIVEALGRGALQGATFGFADEIAGGVESLFGDKTYEQARDESRANFDAAAKAHGIADTIGQVGGNVLSMLVPAGVAAKVGGTVGKGAQAMSALMKANPVKTGAAMGAVGATGASETDKANTGQLATEAALGGVIGGALPVAGKLLGGAVGIGKDFVSRNVKSVLDPTEVMGNLFNVNKDKLGEAIVARSKGKANSLADALDGFRKLIGPKESVHNFGDVARIVEERAMTPAIEVFDALSDRVAGVPIDNGLVSIVKNEAGEAAAKVSKGFQSTLADEIKRQGYSGDAEGAAQAAVRLLGEEGQTFDGLIRVKQILGNLGWGRSDGKLNEVPAKAAVFRRAWTDVSERIDELVSQHVPDMAPQLKEANRLYSMANVIGDAATSETGRWSKLANMLGASTRDVVTGGSANLIAQAAGADPEDARTLGLIAGGASALGRTVPGALMRANAGEWAGKALNSIGQKAGQIASKAPTTPAMLGEAASLVPQAIRNQVAELPARKKTPQEKAMARIQLERQGMSPTEMVRAQMAIENEE